MKDIGKGVKNNHFHCQFTCSVAVLQDNVFPKKERLPIQMMSIILEWN